MSHKRFTTDLRCECGNPADKLVNNEWICGRCADLQRRQYKDFNHRITEAKIRDAHCIGAHVCNKKEI